MMKIIHQDAGQSAVTSSSGVGADRRRASATPRSRILTIFNSLLPSGFPCPHSNKSYEFAAFPSVRNSLGAIKFPVIFPVSRELVRLRAQPKLAKNKCRLIVAPGGHGLEGPAV